MYWKLCFFKLDTFLPRLYSKSLIQQEISLMKNYLNYLNSLEGLFNGKNHITW